MRHSPRRWGQTLPWRASEQAVIGEGLLDPDAIAEIADELGVVLPLATLRVSPPRPTLPQT